MAGQDTRVAERIPAAMRIKLKYGDLDTFIQKYSVNISRGGVFIATRAPKPVGTLLRFEFQLATSMPVIRGEGEVVWVKSFDPEQPRKVHGMGVRFTKLDHESKAIVDRALLWKKDQTTPKGPTRETVAQPDPIMESQVVLAARHIVELTAANIYYPEDTELADLLKPVRIVLPKSGREAAGLLAALLEGHLSGSAKDYPT